MKKFVNFGYSRALEDNLWTTRDIRILPLYCDIVEIFYYFKSSNYTVVHVLRDEVS